MRGDEIGNHVESDAPPNSTENVAGEILHAAEQANGVVDLRQILK